MLPLALRYPVSFAVSINAARDDLRSLLMPINRKYPLRELVAEMKRIPLQSGRKVTAEYVLLAGVNDSPEDARALARSFRGARIKVNLIPFNPHEASPYRAPEAEVVDRFRTVLIAGGVQTITRERRGADIRAACGQLRTAAGGSGGVAAGGGAQ
jgi:23S rRNA (adenine2503-C2)-methyltransferase